MSSRDQEVNMEFAFIRENSVSQREKVKAFWKFLDAQNCLQPHEGTLGRESPPEAPVTSAEEITKERDVWRKGLEVFRQLGLDKTALAAANRCRLCLVHKTIQCEDLADTVAQPYEELNADMRAFEQHHKSRGSSQRKAPHAGSK